MTRYFIFATEIEQFGGAERSMLALTDYLFEASIDRAIVVFTDHVGLSSHARHPVDVIQLGHPRSITARIALVRSFVSSTAPFAILGSAYQAALYLSVAGASFHVLMHDTPSLFSRDSTNPLRRLTRRLRNAMIARGLQRGGTCIVTSSYLMEECNRIFATDAKIARMGGVTASTIGHAGANGHQLEMLSVCRLEENKRIGWILSALEHLETMPLALSEKVDWTLHLVGTGSLLEEITATVNASEPLRDRVVVHGFVSDESLVELYERSSLFLMPARQGYGIPAIEALSRGLPVLLHRESGVSDLLLHTPWATVTYAGASSFTNDLELAVRRVSSQEHRLVAPPVLPTEATWARQIATICGWQ